MRNFDFRRYAPVLLIALLVITPLAIWAATSGGSGNDGKTFYVERAVGLNGEPELLVTVDDPDVQVDERQRHRGGRCTDATGKVDRRGHPAVALPDRAGLPTARARRGVGRRGRADPAVRASIGTNKKLAANVQ